MLKQSPQPQINRGIRRQEPIDDIGDTQSVLAVDDDDFALGNEASVEQQIHGGMQRILEFNDDSGAEGKHVAQTACGGFRSEV